ncbi:hypothetical protein E2C01_008903 [Portunus trituberculatus]|uniref:Uncharacterized protein n=1 Tax=Portunus trituberculatus TaxID=210409 RepID=A0A5B7D563_PORTR|nr:hypothetical protein [Portunus trituberculatus]
MFISANRTALARVQRRISTRHGLAGVAIKPLSNGSMPPSSTILQGLKNALCRDASINEVSWLICSLGSTVLKKTEVMPEPHTADDRVNSMQRWFLMRGSSGGISMGKQGGA